MNFEKYLLKAVDEALSSLGESSKHLIYLHLENSFSIGKQDIPYKIQDFCSAIEIIFGFGARILEIKIMKLFYKNAKHMLKSLPEIEDLVFIEYMLAAKLSSRHYGESKSITTFNKCSNFQLSQT